MSSQANPPAYGEAQPPPPQYIQGGGYGYQPVPRQGEELHAFAGGPGPAQAHAGYPSGYPGGAPGYAPAPGTFPMGVQQQSTSNVVVVSQPSVPTVCAVQVIPRSNDYMVLTIVMMVCCFFHGNLPAFFCLVPALVFASMAADRNDAGSYDEARQYGRWALWCNVGTFIYYGIAVVVSIAVFVGVYVTARNRCDVYYDDYCY